MDYHIGSGSPTHQVRSSPSEPRNRLLFGRLRARPDPECSCAIRWARRVAHRANRARARWAPVSSIAAASHTLKIRTNSNRASFRFMIHRPAPQCVTAAMPPTLQPSLQESGRNADQSEPFRGGQAPRVGTRRPRSRRVAPRFGGHRGVIRLLGTVSTSPASTCLVDYTVNMADTAGASIVRSSPRSRGMNAQGNY